MERVVLVEYELRGGTIGHHVEVAEIMVGIDQYVGIDVAEGIVGIFGRGLAKVYGCDLRGQFGQQALEIVIVYLHPRAVHVLAVALHPRAGEAQLSAERGVGDGRQRPTVDAWQVFNPYVVYVDVLRRGHIVGRGGEGEDAGKIVECQIGRKIEHHALPLPAAAIP